MIGNVFTLNLGVGQHLAIIKDVLQQLLNVTVMVIYNERSSSTFAKPSVEN